MIAEDMKRRSLLKVLAAAAPLAPLSAQPQQPRPAPNAAPAGARPFGAAMEPPKVETSIADAVADMTPRFFTSPQLSALRSLSNILQPPLNGAPGALDAHAAEFLDFLIAESPAGRQQLYRAGLDALNADARRRFNKAFAELDAAQATELLAPLRAPWTFDPPADPLARFLREAKADIHTATTNSREYAAANTSSGRRGFGGQGLYWYALD